MRQLLLWVVCPVSGLSRSPKSSRKIQMSQTLFWLQTIEWERVRAGSTKTAQSRLKLMMERKTGHLCLMSVSGESEEGRWNKDEEQEAVTEGTGWWSSSDNTTQTTHTSREDKPAARPPPVGWCSPLFIKRVNICYFFQLALLSDIVKTWRWNLWIGKLV